MGTEAICPGCGSATTFYGSVEDCDHCEYFNLVAGRTHYCGRGDCYCANLRTFMRSDVLKEIAEETNRCPVCGSLPTDSGHQPGLYDDSTPYGLRYLCSLYFVGGRYQRRLSYSDAEIESQAAQ
jgi:hypothetical protein